MANIVLPVKVFSVVLLLSDTVLLVCVCELIVGIDRFVGLFAFRIVIFLFKSSTSALTTDKAFLKDLVSSKGIGIYI